jgi:hypothetical protein
MPIIVEKFRAFLIVLYVIKDTTMNWIANKFSNIIIVLFNHYTKRANEQKTSILSLFERFGN